MDLESAIASFRAGTRAAAADEALLLLKWSDQHWQELFRFTSIRSFRPGDALIRHGEPDRTLYFVLRGQLEVIVRSGDGLSMGRVALVGAGSVLGELAFFDGGPRSAAAWAVDHCDVAAMTVDQYSAFENVRPALARELLFALGCGEPMPDWWSDTPFHRCLLIALPLRKSIIHQEQRINEVGPC
jgi:CRP/FNR family transcriptional regulator, cyclic AMP receptor protein